MPNARQMFIRCSILRILLPTVFSFALYCITISPQIAGNGALDPYQTVMMQSFVQSLGNSPLPKKERALQLPTPVIVVGYPKSGTTSVYSFFNCSGIVSQHFCCCGDRSDHPPCKINSMATCILENMAIDGPLFQNCGNYQVYAQIDGERPVQFAGTETGVLMENGQFQVFPNSKPRERSALMRHFLPQHFHLNRIHRDYPNATFILPLRDPTEWANSAFNWFQMRGRVINEYMAFNSSISRPGKQNAKAFLSRVFTEHAQFIRDFVQKYPSHALVEFDITDENAGDLLGNAFGLSSSCWGHHNKIGTRAKQASN